MKSAIPSLCLVILALSLEATAEDWPMYRKDPRRSGYTAEALPRTIRRRWSYQLRLAPTPAWPRVERMVFDRVCHPVIGNGLVYLGNSADGKVSALDLTTGKLAWDFFTDGPVRFAPVCWRDRVFVASDDGHLYALSASEGTLLWKTRGGPADDMVLANGRMSSRWPVRGGPVVDGNLVYFGAGIWPTEGVYIYAVDAHTGKVRWRNGESCHLRLQQPHGGAWAKSGISAQGYLVSTKDALYIPPGRAIPWCLDKQSGKFRYFHLNRYGQTGGGMTLAGDGYFLSGGKLFDAATGQSRSSYGGTPEVNRCLARTPDGVLVSAGPTISFGTIGRSTTTDRKGRSVTTVKLDKKWSARTSGVIYGMIVAADRIICGGQGRVDIVDIPSRKVVTSLESLKGTVYGLAYANGSLVVSTSSGSIYCYGKGGTRTPRAHTASVAGRFSRDASRLAKEIARTTGITKGFCLDLGCGDGSLSHALATQTDLRVVAVRREGKDVKALRRKFEAAGLYGNRIVVLHRDLNKTTLPNYFADLIVSGSGAIERSYSLRKEIQRLQRPCGGVVCTGTSGRIKTQIRGALEGSGQWTHQYADAGNTLCSGDERVKGDLAMLWYREYDIELTSRHNRGPSPLYADGRLFHFGRHDVIAVDAYNGRELWRYELRDLLSFLDYHGVSTASGIGCIGEGILFVRHQGTCRCLDAATGKLVRSFTVPGERDGFWGYLAYSDGILHGSSANKDYEPHSRGGKIDPRFPSLSESKGVFALDAKTGRPIWQYRAKESIRHNAIALDKSSLYLIDRRIDPADRRLPPISGQGRGKDKLPATYPTGVLLALDKATGKVRWRNDQKIYGTVLIASERHKTVLMTYQYAYKVVLSERQDRMVAFDSRTGRIRWDEPVRGGRGRAVVIDRTVYKDNAAWDLLTGKDLKVRFKRTYGCGNISGSRHMLLFRSGTMGYFKLDDQKAGVQNYGGVKTGCFINIVPAGGIVMVPDSTEYCKCSYLNKTWFVLRPVGVRRR